MNLKQAIEIAKENPDLNVFIPMKYDLGLMVRSAKNQRKLSSAILNKAPYLDANGYEVCVYQISNIQNKDTKGSYKRDIPNTPSTWANWEIADNDLQAKNYVLI